MKDQLNKVTWETSRNILLKKLHEIRRHLLNIKTVWIFRDKNMWVAKIHHKNRNLSTYHDHLSVIYLLYTYLSSSPVLGSQKRPRVTGKFGLEVQNEAWKRLTQFWQENALVIANTLFQWHTKWIYIWTPPDGKYWNQNDYVLCSKRWRSSIQSERTRPGTDYGSDNEGLIAKFRFKLKKVGKISRPFRSDLNQIPYDYTVKVRNSFKELDLIDRVPEDLGTEVHDIVQEAVTKTMPKKKKCKKAKWLSEESLQIAEKRGTKGKGERKRHAELNADFQRITRRNKKAFLYEQCK